MGLVASQFQINSGKQGLEGDRFVKLLVGEGKAGVGVGGGRLLRFEHVILQFNYILQVYEIHCFIYLNDEFYRRN